MNTTIRRPNHLVAIAMLWTLPVLSGCGRGISQSAPSTPGDPAAIYQGEVDYLERLEKDHRELVERFKADMGPIPSDALGQVEKLVEASRKSVSEPAETDPRAAMAKAEAKAQQDKEAVTRLLEALGEKSEEERNKISGLTEEFQKKLESLDRDIVDQKQRVQAARRDTDGGGTETE